MKSRFLKFCLLACIPFFSITCSESLKLTGNEFLIEGIISNVEDGAVISLSRWEGDSGTRIEQDTIQNGRFMIKAEAILNPERMTITVSGDDEFPPMFLGVWVAPKTKIKISGKGKMHPLWEVKSPIKYQKEESRYVKNSRDVIAENAKNSIVRNAAMQKIMAAMMAGSSGDVVLVEKMLVDSLDVLSKQLQLRQTSLNIDLMEKTEISPVWLNKMREIATAIKYSDPDAEYSAILRKKAEALYDRMSEDDKTTHIGYRITATLFPPLVVGVGDYFADGDFLDINGNTKHLSDYLGKYLLLDFWSRGCGPCIMALPEMKEVSETYPENLTIISISLDPDAAWKDAMKTHDMPWVNIRDPKAYGGLAANYGVSGIPNYVIISPEGKIIDKWMGFGNGLIKRKVSANIK